MGAADAQPPQGAPRRAELEPAGPCRPARRLTPERQRDRDWQIRPVSAPRLPDRRTVRASDRRYFPQPHQGVREMSPETKSRLVAAIAFPLLVLSGTPARAATAPAHAATAPARFSVVVEGSGPDVILI